MWRNFLIRANFQTLCYSAESNRPATIRKIGLGLLYSFLILFLFPSCGTNKYLEPGQTYLQKNKVQFEAPKKIKNQRAIKYDLSTIYKQNPNEKSLRLFRTRLWFYYKFSNSKKSSKFRNWVKRVIAEPPAIYSEELADATAQTMQYFMQNQGYYDAEVTFKPVHKKKTTSVVYTVKPNDLYTIDSLKFVSKDEQIQRILNDISDKSFLKHGREVSNSLFDKEKERIKKTIKNLGYAYFDHNFIDPAGYVDTSKHLVDVVYEVLPLKDGKPHPIYRIGSIDVIPRYNPADQTTLKDTIINGLNFHIDPVKPFLKPQTVAKAILLRPGELFKNDNLDRTNQSLANLEIYKFISVKPTIDSLDPGLLNFEIRLTPKKRMVLGWDIEANTSNYSNSTNNSPVSLLGVAARSSYKNRNLFRNATTLTAEFLAGTELNFSDSFSIWSVDIQANFEIFIPKYKGVTGFWKGLNALGIVSDNFFTRLKEKAKTRISFNYNKFSTVNYYRYNSFNTTLGFDLQLSASDRIRVNTTGINYFLPQTEPAFEDIIAGDQFLQRSITKQFFTGLLFRDLRFTHAGKSNRFGESWFFTAAAELSGAEVLAINSIYNRVAKKSGSFTIGDVDFEQFWRLELDGRYYRKFSSRYSVATRLNIGIAQPFGPYSPVTPYVKQFTIGGPNSIRAWSLRELGPGSYFDPTLTQTIFYQAADFKLEFSFEYRFDLFSFFEGALFLDGGNIWSLNKNDDRGADARLSTDFYKQLALGTGAGLRIDIKYAILRFDLGLKMRKPFLNPDIPDDSFWLIKDWKRLKNSDLLNLNLAIGYSF